MKASRFLIFLFIANWCFGQSKTIPSGIYVWNSSESPYEQVLSGSTTFLDPLQVSVETLKPGEINGPTSENEPETEELLIVKEGNLTFNCWKVKANR